MVARKPPEAPIWLFLIRFDALCSTWRYPFGQGLSVRFPAEPLVPGQLDLLSLQKQPFVTLASFDVSLY
jgi:hypothetical protein